MMADHRYSHLLFKGRKSSLAIAALRDGRPTFSGLTATHESRSPIRYQEIMLSRYGSIRTIQSCFISASPRKRQPLWLNRGSKAHGALMRSDGSSWWAVFQIPIRA